MLTTKLFCFMKNAMLIILLCLISNCLLGQNVLSKKEYDTLFEAKSELIETIEQLISSNQGTSKKNHFEFKVKKGGLRKLEPVSPGQQPGWSYFWNYGDGNFYITTEELGKIHHTYTHNDTFLLRVETTPIKTPEDDDDDLVRILLDMDSIRINELNLAELNPSKKDLTTKITKGKSVQLLSSRCAVPGEPFTIIISAKDTCKRQTTADITFSFNLENIEYVDTIGNYYRDIVTKDSMRTKNSLTDSIIYNINILNPKRDEQRNYFANFKTKPDIEIGKEIEFIVQYINGCNTISDTLILKTAKSHDPSFKLMSFPEAIKNCEVPVINELDVFIHFENDGEGSTSTISIVDSIVPPLKIGDVECFQTIDSLCINMNSMVESDSCLLENDTISILTILHTPDTGNLILTIDTNSTCLFNDTIFNSYNDIITIAFDSIKLKGKKAPGYLTEFPPIETMDEVKFKVKAREDYSAPFFCNIADIYFDANEAESVFDCVFHSCDCDSLMRVRKSILKGSCTIELGKDTVLNPDYSKLDFTPDKYIWWPDEETDSIITVSPAKDKLYMVAASYFDTETGIEQYVIGRKIVYVNPPGRIDTSLIKERIIQPVSCFDSLDGSFQLKMTAGNYNLKWNDLRKSQSFTDIIKRDSMANGTYIYTITNNADLLKYTDTVVINEPPPLFFEYKITKTQDEPNSLYDIASIVYGGVPDYEIIWMLDNGNIVNSFNINNVGAGTHFVEVKDLSNWILRDTIYIPNCDILNPVIIPDDLIEVCVGQSTELLTENKNIIDGFEQFFVLHSDSNDLSSVIDYNEDGRFWNDGNYIRNNELYVSSIVVPVDDNGTPDFNYFCANIDLKSTPIVFYEPIEINADVICHKCKGAFDVVFTITGGAADYSPNNKSYLVTGIYNGNVTPGKRVYTTLQDGSNYEIYVIDDGSGWGTELISEPIQCCKLPIELLQFTGKAKEEGNLLEWETATEIENDYFNLSYSKDGVEFEDLQKVNGQGTSSSNHKYQYLHQNPVSELSYYRLAQTDRNGTTSVVGNVNVIRNKNQQFDVSLFPNPATNNIQLTILNNSSEQAALIIYSNTGDKHYQSQNLPLIQKDIDIASWPKGIYFVQLKIADDVITKKFIKY